MNADNSHPLVVTLLDAGLEADPPHYVIDLLEGGSLQQFVESTSPGSLDRVIDWSLEICDALATAAIVLAITAGDVAVFFNQGGGSFSSASRIATGNAPTSVAVADVNRDGRPDLAVANNLSNDVSIVLNEGDGSFAPAANFTTGEGPTSVAVADFDRDGDPDLAVSHMISGVVGVYLNDGAGCFTCDR